MAFDIQISNYALSYIGDRRIESFSDNSKEARLCSLFFTQSVNEVLQMVDWKESVKRQRLTMNTEPPLHGWEYSYRLPEDCIRLLTVNEDFLSLSKDFEIEGDNILSNDSEIYLRYISEITDFSNASPLFIKSVSYNLACNIALSLTGSLQIKQSMYQMMSGVVNDAIYRQKQESRSGENSKKRRFRSELSLLKARGRNTDRSGFGLDRIIPLIQTVPPVPVPDLTEISLTNGVLLGNDDNYSYYLYDTNEEGFDWVVNRRDENGLTETAKGTNTRPDLQTAINLIYT